MTKCSCTQGDPGRLAEERSHPWTGTGVPAPGVLAGEAMLPGTAVGNGDEASDIDRWRTGRCPAETALRGGFQRAPARL